MQARYGRVLSSPGVARTVVPYLVGRLPSSMNLLALLLFIRHTSGSFVTAGGVSAAFALAVAVSSPVLGRLVDMRGQTGVLVATSIVHPLALIGVLVAASQSAGAPVVLAAAALAGASLPPISACMRALWPSLLRDAEQRETAFGLEAVVVEICELGGPLLVGGLTAVVSPGAAVLVSAVLTGAGALLFALAPASRDAVRGAWQTRRWRGPLEERGVRWLLAIIAFSTAGLAAFEVAIAGFATGHGGAASTGTLLALWFGGSLAGGWWYGARRWATPLPWQLVGLLLAVAVGALLPLLATGTWTMAALLLVSGVAIAPAIAVQLAVMSEVAPERSRTEAFTWASTANFVGIAGGSALAGWSVELAGVRAGLVASAGLAAVTALLSVAGRHGLGLPRLAHDAAVEAAEDAYDLAVFEDLAQERDDAVAALARAAERNAELLDQLTALRGQLQDGSHQPPTGRAASAAAEIARTGLARLDASLADLYLLEQRRAAVLEDIEQLRAELLSWGLPENVTALPRQSHGA
ncbi:MAG: major facilitator superfamily 1 [Frankiales bacterium]|nr:major facilitator superfamily 1 [Frankiales bacterium]